MAKIFGFPNPVDEHAARTVATGVVVLATVTLATGWAPLSLVLMAGFWARVLTGPTLSPLGQLATKVVAPLFAQPVLTAGPPKRFAQGIGAVLSSTCVVLWLTTSWSVAQWVLVPLIVAASLEAFAGFCLGCYVFAKLMALGVIPESTCLECAEINRRHPELKAARS